MSAIGLKACGQCGRGFRAYHGNQKYCGTCKAARKSAQWWMVQAYGVRECARCRREFQPLSANQKFCSRYCKDSSRPWWQKAKYATPEHRGRRMRWAPAVATGTIRCARGAACRRREYVDGELVGGLISPFEKWHLGHADGESVGGPEHVRCNTGAPSRLRAGRR